MKCIAHLSSAWRRTRSELLLCSCSYKSAVRASQPLTSAVIALRRVEIPCSRNSHQLISYSTLTQILYVCARLGPSHLSRLEFFFLRISREYLCREDDPVYVDDDDDVDGNDDGGCYVHQKTSSRQHSAKTAQHAARVFATTKTFHAFTFHSSADRSDFEGSTLSE